MKLAVNQFFEYRPASQWAFEVTFSNPMVLTNASTIGKNYQLQETNVFTQTDLDRISQAVVSCTQPKFDIDPMTTSYGNFDFTLPIYDVNNIKLVITFEDTDDCLISYKFLSSLMGGSTANKIPAWLNVHEAIRITITEYNTYQYDYARPNSKEGQFKNWNVTSVKHYLCKLCEYTEPNYNRTSESPQATTLKLTFLVIPDGIHLLDNENVETAGVEQLDLYGELKKLKENLKKELNNLVTSKDIALSVFGKNKFEKAEKAENIKKLGEEIAKFAKEKYNTSRVTPGMAQEWVTAHTDLYEKGNSQCGKGVSYMYALTEQANNLDSTVNYTPHGNGKDWGYNNASSYSSTREQIDSAANLLKNGESFTVSIDNGSDYGHVVIVSRDSTGTLRYTSDFDQRTWTTYPNFDDKNVKLRVIDTEGTYAAISARKTAKAL